MPVNLDVIPDIAPTISRPHTLRWLIFWVFLLLVGTAVTLWFWKREHSGMAFWFAALGIPTALWGIVFSLRRISYKCDQIWAAAWNKERENLLDEETQRGQRKLWLHGYSSVTSIGNKTETLVKAILSNTPLMSSLPPRAGGSALRHTHLESSARAEDLLQVHLSSQAARMIALLDTLPAEIPCYLLFDIHIDTDPDIRNRLVQEYNNALGRRLRLVHGSGFSALDQWLDMAWRVPSALLVIGAQLYDQPVTGSGEAVIGMLLSNRQPFDTSQAVCVHRPEKGASDSLSKTLERALLWAKSEPVSITQAWLTGDSLLTDGGWINACEQNALELDIQKQCPVIDNIIGFTGVAAPWLVLIIAAVKCRENGSTQTVAVQTATDEIWVGCLTAPSSDFKDIQDTPL